MKTHEIPLGNAIFEASQSAKVRVLSPNVLKSLPISSIAQFPPPDVLWRGLLLPALTHCAKQDLFALLNAIIARLYVNHLSYCPWEVSVADIVLDQLRRHGSTVVGGEFPRYHENQLTLC
jgi:hypothetical protein